MTTDASRDAFESAHSHLSTASLRRNGGNTGCYTTAATAFAWAMWQASRKQALEDAKQTNVTCQIYGHVVGACVECNTHIEKAPTIVPMTDLEVSTALNGIGSSGLLMRIVRAVEAHHGIK